MFSGDSVTGGPPALRRGDLTYVQGGWGKIAAAASTQYVIDHQRPERLINIGTAGGLPGRLHLHDLLFVTGTVSYDVIERMRGPEGAREAVAHYTTRLEVPAFAAARDRKIGRIVSGDQDLDPANVEQLIRDFDADAGDWESAAVAYVCRRNEAPLWIIRGISDIVAAAGSPAYTAAAGAGYAFFEDSSRTVFCKLLDVLAELL